MALGATIYRLRLDVADIDRGIYGERVLTLARHPSETEERMMIRVLAYAMHDQEGLEFGRGLSTDDEPDLWQRDATGRILTWIDVGLPEERRLRRACGRADRVVALAFGGPRVDVWWRRLGRELSQLSSLTVNVVENPAAHALAAMAARSMRLSVTIQEGVLLFSDGERIAEVVPRVLPTEAR
ncbi:MAG: YaeQ family protein [Burkholderiaceae bacterium]